MTIDLQVARKHQDPIRRFTPTSLSTTLYVMGRRVRLETNSGTLFERSLKFFEPAEGSSSAPFDFLWRWVGEANSGLKPPWPEMTAFSDHGLRYVSLGQRSFFGVDLEAREAIAFLAEDLARDEAGFSSVFASTLFDLTAAALGLVQISAACVALQGTALLIFGPPRSGKTTSTYLAAQLGLEFHADEASFLDLQPGGLRVWGQFWPAAFREETTQFISEVAPSAQSLTYGSLKFLLFKDHKSLPARAVVPVGCVFLERQAAMAPRLIPLASAELANRLRGASAFIDDARFASQYASALRALGELPAYRLLYGDDPGEAARLYPDLVTRMSRHPSEVRR
jgi:hypothetical protein